MEYDDSEKLNTLAVEMAKEQKGAPRRLKALVNQPGDKASDFLWNVTKATLLYSADLLGEIADDITQIDNAMKWGFGWQQGPFELWDAIGVAESVKRMEKEGVIIPEWVKKFVEDGNETFYKEENNNLYYYDQGEYKQINFNKKEFNITRVKKERDVIMKNSGASLIDMGDGVALL